MTAKRLQADIFETVRKKILTKFRGARREALEVKRRVSDGLIGVKFALAARRA